MNSTGQAIVTIAVLPFVNISDNNQLNFFALGFVEDLIADLSKYSSIQVLSSHSTIGTQPSGETNTFNANYLVKGSFRQTGNELRINVQLILSSKGTVIWSQRYHEQIDELFEIQGDVLEQIVSALQREIDANLLSISRRKTPSSLAAYEYWLMGMEELKKGSIDADNHARELFQLALQLDPLYARAYAGLSLSYFNEWSCQLWERWDYSQKGAYEYALKAVELDETNYMSMTVLGRLFIYKGEWETAEHYLRKSLRLNPNDCDNLIQISSCFVHLKYLKEAEKLYKKALFLNPANTNWYYSHGGMLYFEMGEYEKCLEQGLKANLESVMVDMSVYISGAYYYLGNYDKMEEYWRKYMEIFERKILRGNPATVEEAVRWARNVNPSKGKSNSWEFLQYITDHYGRGGSINATSNQIQPSGLSIFRKNGELWEMSYSGERVMLAELKGYQDIFVLLSNPHKEFHCSELMTVPVVNGTEERAIDHKAHGDYKRKLAELQEDIDEAISMNDSVRAGLLQEEYDKILAHLKGALGLGGKARKIHDQQDKLRSAVTWRIRKAIRKISESLPALGVHLDNSVKTGVFCSYKPEKEISWNKEYITV